MKKKQLDNMTGQELKEMIDKEIITLEQLDNSALEKIMSYETDMLCLGNGDMMTIRRCAMLLNDREDDDTLTKDDFISIIDKAEKEHITIVNEKEQLPKAKIIKKHITLRRIGLVAAVITVIFATTALVASAFNVNIFEYISDIVRKDQGSRIDVDGFTFYHNGESKQYSSIEEMIEKENLDIMYPTKWPEGVRIESISVSSGVHGNDSIQILTNHINLSVHISIYSLNNSYSYEEKERVIINNKSFYIFKENDYYAYCYYKDNSYSIRADSYDNLILILENLKEK